MRIHTFLLAAGAVLAACSGGDEAAPSEPIVDDNPGRDIAIPRSVADGVRLSRVSIDRPDSKTRYFFFNYDEEGWLTSGVIPHSSPFEVVGRLDTIKLEDTSHYLQLYHLLYDIKRNADGHVTSLARECEDCEDVPLFAEKAKARFYYDEDMRLTGIEETGDYWETDLESGDTLFFQCHDVYNYEYDGDAIRRITLRKEYSPSYHKRVAFTSVAEFSGEEVENRYGTFDFFTSTHGQTMYWALMMTGYMGEWAKRIPVLVHTTNIYIYESGREELGNETDYHLMLECDENGRLYSERGKFFHYLE